MNREPKDILKAPQRGDRLIHRQVGKTDECVDVVKVGPGVTVCVTGQTLIPVTRFFVNTYAFRKAYGHVALG